MSGKGSAATAAEKRSAILAGERDCGDHVIGVTGKYYPNGHLAIVGSVGGVKSAAAGIESDIATDALP